jgi:hypothetical protein
MKDFLLDLTNGKLFANGDISTGTSDKQNMDLLIECEKGSFKEFPATCVGAASYLESEDAAGFLRDVRTQFQADGITVNKIVFEGDTMKVDAKY